MILVIRVSFDVIQSTEVATNVQWRGRFACMMGASASWTPLGGVLEHLPSWKRFEASSVVFEAAIVDTK